MQPRRVLLLSVQPLLSESLASILSSVKDIVLIGPRATDAAALASLTDEAPDVVLIAEQEDQHEEAVSFMAQILEQYPELPVIHVGLSQNLIRLYSSQSMPARSADLIGAICDLPAYRGWGAAGK